MRCFGSRRHRERWARTNCSSLCCDWGRQALMPRLSLRRKKKASRNVLLVATRKGAWLFHSEGARRSWRADGPHFLGHIINHLVLDPRDGRTMLAAASTGHLGPTIFRSTDFGKTWKEA